MKPLLLCMQVLTHLEPTSIMAPGGQEERVEEDMRRACECVREKCVRKSVCVRVWV